MAGKDFLTDAQMEAELAKPAASGTQAADHPEFISDDDMAHLEEHAPQLFSPLESAAIGASQGATFGFSDEIGAGAKSLYDVATTDKTLSDLPALYKENQAQLEDAVKQSRAENPLAAGAGQLAGGIGTSLAGGALVKGGQLAGRAASALFAPESLIAGGAASGAVQGAGEAGPGNRLAGAVEGGVLGALTGGALKATGGALKGAKALGSLGIKAVSNYFDPDVLKATVVGASKADLKKAGELSVKEAVKTADEFGIFAREGALPPGLEEIRDRLQGLLDTSQEKVQQILGSATPNAPTTVIGNLDLKGLNQLRNKLASNITDEGQRAAVSQIDDLVDNVVKHFDDAGGDVNLLQLQEYKQVLQSRIKELGGYMPGQIPKPLVEAMQIIEEQVRKRIESLAPGVKELNRAQGAALSLLPRVDGKLAGDAANGIKGLGSFGNVMRFAGGSLLGGGPVTGALAVGADAALGSTQGMLMRAGIPRTIEGIRSRLPDIAKMNPGLAGSLSEILRLPANKVGPALGPLIAQFQDDFEPASYSSMVDGKLYSPEDMQAYREQVKSSIADPIARAKALSALNKDGTVSQ